MLKNSKKLKSVLSNPKNFSINFKPIGGAACLVEWPNIIDEDILQDILLLQSRIENSLDSFVVETINAYNSLTIIYKPAAISFSDLREKIQSLYESEKQAGIRNTKTWKIPVSYDMEFGIDLESIAQSKNMTVDEIIRIHSKAEYTIYFMGFLPGFLYLGGLPDSIHAPRKSTPRLRIKKGAVAIGGKQTGIYPFESPGGWNIIGNSPVSLFNTKTNPPCFANTGDHLRFFSIDKEQYNEIQEKIKHNSYAIEFE